MSAELADRRVIACTITRSHRTCRVGVTRGYQRWAASSPVTCGHDCGLLSPEAAFRSADRVPRSRTADSSMPVGHVSSCHARSRPPGAEPGSGADPGSWASAFPAQARQCQRGSATHSPAPALAPRPQQAPASEAAPPACASHGRAIPPGPAPRGQAPVPAARRHTSLVRPIQARNNSGEYPLSPEGAKPLLSTADLLPSCYQDPLPSTPKYPYLYSNYALELGGAKRARTADLLHAMRI